MNRNAGQNPTDAADAGKGWTTLLMSVLATVLILAKDIGFSLWARRKLYSEFRERAAQVVGPTRRTVPPPLPRADLPPVIAPT